MRRRYFAMGLVFFVILFVPLFIFTGQNAGGKPTEGPVETPYQYPITPADEAWVDFKTSQEMYDACQIPDNVLTRMTTEALLETVLNYPFLGTYKCYDDCETAAGYLCGQFNGLEELLARDDLTGILLARYAKSKVLTQEELNENSHLRLGYVDTFFESENLEFLIGCDRLRNGQYSEADSETFNALFSEKSQVRKEESNIYSGTGGTYAAFAGQLSEM